MAIKIPKEDQEVISITEVKETQFLRTKGRGRRGMKRFSMLIFL